LFSLEAFILEFITVRAPAEALQISCYEAVPVYTWCFSSNELEEAILEEAERR
jgi:hypothetical protein